MTPFINKKSPKNTTKTSKQGKNLNKELLKLIKG